MLEVRKSGERFHTKIGWLDSRHTFSFAEHYDPRFMGFRALRVINEDRVAPGSGFDTHPHRDMEIVTYIVDGSLSHRDSMGNGSTIRPGDVQRMTAGTGVRHSEHNEEHDRETHLLQIWIAPERRSLPPSYEQRMFAQDERRGRLRLVASHDGRDGSVTIHQDVALYATLLEPGERAELAIAPGRHAWVQIVRGAATVNGASLAAGDGAALAEEARLDIAATEQTEALVFDLA